MTTPAAEVAANKQADIDKHVQQIVDASPPLTVEQRDRLALLLRGAGATS